MRPTLRPHPAWDTSSVCQTISLQTILGGPFLLVEHLRRQQRPLACAVCSMKSALDSTRRSARLRKSSKLWRVQSTNECDRSLLFSAAGLECAQRVLPLQRGTLRACLRPSARLARPTLTASRLQLSTDGTATLRLFASSDCLWRGRPICTWIAPCAGTSPPGVCTACRTGPTRSFTPGKSLASSNGLQALCRTGVWGGCCILLQLRIESPSGPPPPTAPPQRCLTDFLLHPPRMVPLLRTACLLHQLVAVGLVWQPLRQLPVWRAWGSCGSTCCGGLPCCQLACPFWSTQPLLWTHTS